MKPVVAARSEAGSLSLELVVLAPAILLILALVVAGGRAVVASQAVAQAASQAARDASLQSSPSAGVAAARSRAASVLEGQGLACAPRTVSTNATALAKPAGQLGMVTVSVACTVSWSDLGLPTAGSRTLTATGSAPLDTWTTR